MRTATCAALTRSARPLDRRGRYGAGEPFAFTVILFGDCLDYLPYLALGAEGMAAGGIGRKDDSGRRGRFTIESITSTNPLTKTTAILMKPGERMVEAVTAPVNCAHVSAAAAELADRLEAQGNRLRVTFATPTRLIKRRGKIGTPEPFQLIKSIAQRLLDLSAQYGGGRPTAGSQRNGSTGRALALKRDLYPYADAVTLIEDETRWWGRKRLFPPFAAGAETGRIHRRRHLHRAGLAAAAALAALGHAGAGGKEHGEGLRHCRAIRLNSSRRGRGNLTALYRYQFCGAGSVDI